MSKTKKRRKKNESCRVIIMTIHLILKVTKARTGNLRKNPSAKIVPSRVKATTTRTTVENVQSGQRVSGDRLTSAESDHNRVNRTKTGNNRSEKYMSRMKQSFWKNRLRRERFESVVALFGNFILLPPPSRIRLKTSTSFKIMKFVKYATVFSFLIDWCKIRLSIFCKASKGLHWI